MRLESIRNRSGLLMVVIGVAMFAFIMMDLMSSQRSGGPTDLSVGEVYGESIDVQDFEARVQISLISKNKVILKFRSLQFVMLFGTQ